jgi:hydroxymethylglutaryl-CoA reductase
LQFAHPGLGLLEGGLYISLSLPKVMQRTSGGCASAESAPSLHELTCVMSYTITAAFEFLK